MCLLVASTRRIRPCGLHHLIGICASTCATESWLPIFENFGCQSPECLAVARLFVSGLDGICGSGQNVYVSVSNMQVLRCKINTQMPEFHASKYGGWLTF